MEKSEFSVKHLPDGRTLVYPTTPGTVLYGESYPYGFTRVVNRAWIEAANVFGYNNYTRQEIEYGWPLAMEPFRLARLQFPVGDNDGQTYISTALIAACKRGTLRHKVFDHHDYVLKNGKWVLAVKFEDYAIGASDFAVWLAAQGEAPSVHIAAWFKAVGVASAATAQPPVPTAVPVGADSAPDGVDTDQSRATIEEAPANKPPKRRSTWWSVASAYMVDVMRAGQYTKAKELFNELEKTAGPDTPFDKGTGNQRGNLFVREIAKPLTLKTLQNNWLKLKEIAQE